MHLVERMKGGGTHESTRFKSGQKRPRRGIAHPLDRLRQRCDEQDRRVEVEDLGSSGSFRGGAPAEGAAGLMRCQHPLVTVFAGLVKPLRNGLVLEVLAKGFQIHALLCLKTIRLVNSPQTGKAR